MVQGILYKVIHKSFRNFRTGLRNNQTDTAERSITIGRGSLQVICVSRSVDMLLFGVTIRATVPQRSEIPEGLMNYPVLIFQEFINI
jgi:hypothetical protein